MPALTPFARRTTLTRSVVTFLVIRPQTVTLGLPPFRSALPFRLRFAASAQSGAATPSAPDGTDLAEPRTAPSRYANGAAVVAADPRPGVGVAPSAPLSRTAPFRSPDRHRLLDCPAHNAQGPRTNSSAARQLPSAARLPKQVLGSGRRLAGPQRPRSPLARLARFRLMPREASMLAANNAARSCVRLVRKAHSRPNANARHQARIPPLASGHASCPRRWRSGRASVTAKALALRQPLAFGLRRVPRPSSESCRPGLLVPLRRHAACFPLRALLTLCPRCPPTERVRHPVRDTRRRHF